ncbi:MAG: type 2 isopentenyl-diphosphate Delta-isomerase [bacterium]|jgi:isopentenyl-diphosphate delta-isomerase|nr:type 2 isopentenyl-diphosphate Delta-isomerase [candidate division KSB1 bacterium]MDH7561632.1 type 2 isopentenyl-diphosphate Delta-isomerase [bacterium]
MEQRKLAVSGDDKGRTNGVDSVAARKADHLEICLSQDVSFRALTTGFEQIQLLHCALPEVALERVDTGTTFLGRALSMPLMITGMTGGFAQAEEVNTRLAQACKSQRVALGLGSQRQLLENQQHVRSFSAVREVAPDIPLVGNIGVAQVAQRGGLGAVERIMRMVEVDALAVHLNPLHEALQPEGDTDFGGVLAALQQLVEELPVPVIVKETGAGISKEVAQRLADIGVRYIDVSGAGGTSWAAVEYYRGADPRLAEKFWDWGIPTALCLQELRSIPGLHLLASGGVRDGLDVAKALALGAEMAGAAAPFLRALFGKEGPTVEELISQWREEFRLAMFLTGCAEVDRLREVRYFLKGRFMEGC